MWKLDAHLHAERLRPFDREVEGPVPDELRKPAHGSGAAEHDRVVFVLREAVVVEQAA